MQSEKQLAAHTKDLNLFGCFVETMSPFPQGTKVRLRISRAGAHVSALGKVADSRPNAGMGIAFITIRPVSWRAVQCHENGVVQFISVSVVFRLTAL